MTESTTKTKTKPPNAGKGRVKGVPNKITGELRTMIRQALENAGGKGGGVAYLTKQAKENPKAFLSLLGRTVPLEVTGAGGGSLVVTIKDYTGRKKNASD